MRTLITTVALFLVTLSLHSQNYITVSSPTVQNEQVPSNIAPLSNFTNQVDSVDDFKYREFLKSAKKSDETFQLGNIEFTKTALTRLIRKGAVNSENLKEFSRYLDHRNPQFSTYLTNTEMIVLYQKFRKGSLDKYLDDLSNAW